MEFKYPLFIIFGLMGLTFWSLDYWKVFKKPELYFISSEQNHFKKNLRRFIFIIGFIGWGFLSYSLMRPRTSEKLSSSNIEVNDIIICMDVSRSMLAMDMEPNRLEAAKQKIRDFIKLRPTDRISVVIFSEKVYTLLPLTTDPSLVDKILAEISIGFLGSGTNIGDGLALSVARAADSETKNKVIILLTDGVANVGTMTPLQAAEEAKKRNIKVYTIGLGSDKDAKIPVGKGFFGTQYQLIPGGSVDYKVLEKISEMTGGKFFPAKSEKGLENILNEIQNLEKTEIKIENQIIYEEHFYHYLVIGVLLIFLVELFKRIFLKDVQ